MLVPTAPAGSKVWPATVVAEVSRIGAEAVAVALPAAGVAANSHEGKSRWCAIPIEGRTYEMYVGVSQVD